MNWTISARSFFNQLDDGDMFSNDDIATIVLENMAINPDGSSDAAAGVAEAASDSIMAR